MPSHTISVLVENEFGVLARVAGLFSSRGFNIESLTVNVAVEERTRSELDSIVQAFRAHVVDIGPRSQTIEVTGDASKIKAFINLVRPLGIKEIVRTGKIAMARSVQLSGNVINQ